MSFRAPQGEESHGYALCSDKPCPDASGRSSRCGVPTRRDRNDSEMDLQGIRGQFGSLLYIGSAHPTYGTRNCAWPLVRPPRRMKNGGFFIGTTGGRFTRQRHVLESGLLHFRGVYSRMKLVTASTKATGCSLKQWCPAWLSMCTWELGTLGKTSFTASSPMGSNLAEGSL